MSRAFVKEVEQKVEDLPDRPVSVHPNLVTAEGLAAIDRTLSRSKLQTRRRSRRMTGRRSPQPNANFATGLRDGRARKS
jgi:hypothetical protein